MILQALGMPQVVIFSSPTSFAVKIINHYSDVYFKISSGYIVCFDCQCSSSVQFNLGNSL